MTKYLLQITIGPVQDYIASARKLRDLWFGSTLLSELSKTVARSLFEQGGRLIFPCVSSKEELEKESSLIVANKILAEIDTDEKPSAIISNAKQAWTDHREEIAQATISKMNDIKQLRFNQSLFEAQIHDSGEFFAAWVEILNGYKDSRSRLEKLLSGRKNLRQFKAPSWDGSKIPKNSLDGIREAVTGDMQKEIKGLLKKNEKLDAQGCIKRFYPLTDSKKRKHFDDLSSVAMRPYIDGVDFSLHTPLLTKYISFFNENTSEETVIADEKVLEEYSECFYPDLSQLKKTDAFETYKSIIRLTGTPSKYACILLGDGDNMGRIIDMIDSSDGHRTFTRLLEKFASGIDSTISEFRGSLIYSGGDDVMAYLPLHTVIQCADAVRMKFTHTMEEIFKELDLSGDKPTFSIGIAIVHHSYPLDQALNAARKAERIAKIEGGRNALAIIQSKRGGNDVIVHDKWEYNDKPGIISRFNAIIDLYKAEKLPSTLGYQLRQARVEAGDNICYSLSEVDRQLTPDNAASAMVLGIFDRKEYADQLTQMLLHQFSIRKLSDELVVARQIAEAQELSEGGGDREI